jgi:hypothetical protein
MLPLIHGTGRSGVALTVALWVEAIDATEVDVTLIIPVPLNQVSFLLVAPEEVEP